MLGVGVLDGAGFRVFVLGLLVRWARWGGYPCGRRGLVVRLARWGELVLRGAPTTPVAGPHSRGRKDWPCREETLRVLSPHAKQVRPIEQWQEVGLVRGEG
ncbi:hypothetical protein GCM10010483_17480 [Actinokineospora diospyrosa]